jgi:hypothetical protein
MLNQNLGQLQPFISVFSQGCRPTCTILERSDNRIRPSPPGLPARDGRPRLPRGRARARAHCRCAPPTHPLHTRSTNISPVPLFSETTMRPNPRRRASCRSSSTSASAAAERTSYTAQCGDDNAHCHTTTLSTAHHTSETCTTAAPWTMPLACTLALLAPPTPALSPDARSRPRSHKRVRRRIKCLTWPIVTRAHAPRHGCRHAAVATMRRRNRRAGRTRRPGPPTPLVPHLPSTFEVSGA